MLRSLKHIEKFHLRAKDGELGKVKDFYFDDHQWVIRYFIVDTGHWLPGRKVLIAPDSVREPDWDEKVLPVNLNKEQVEMSPPIQSQQPISRQHEIELIGYYGWNTYWAPVGIPAMGGMAPVRNAPESARSKMDKADQQKAFEAQSNLRSVDEVVGYHLKAKDGEIGHAEDLIADTENWAIRYLLVDTRNWLPGRKVLVAPEWIDDISWHQKEFYATLSREKIENSPELDPEKPISREYEEKLYEHYGKQKYWE